MVDYKFKIGDEVLLRKDSDYYYQAKNIVGKVIELNEGSFNFIYEVRFTNGYVNNYRNIDLEPNIKKFKKVLTLW